MNSGVDRVNRTLLVMVGLLLLLAAVAALALGWGWFGGTTAGEPVIPDAFSTFIRNNPWYWWAVAALCVVVALLMLRWMIAQLHTSRLTHLDVEADRRDGETVLQAGAIADAVENEVNGFLGVSGASMRLLGTPSNHRHQLIVVLDERADIDAVRSRLSRQTVPNFRQALAFDDPRLDIRLVLAPRQRRQLS
ncbi:MAG: alkaline shock response membrane anchor protein AmaP [Nocardioidaceae bacterium]|nr:alkaline shock response membrane anchor protein AmaP [Nocardioidaceae bacterium]